ncbi:MAG: PucR family transcriptional regulator [Pseudomonadota bacterium]
MTKVITRFFESAAQARSARKELINRQNASPRIVKLFENADGLAERLTAANVDAPTAQAYAARMGSGGAVLMVLAGYKPLGIAQIARDAMAAAGAVDMGGLDEEIYVDDVQRDTRSILADHPLLVSRPYDPDQPNFYMANWPIPLISRRKPFNMSVFPPHSHMASWPVPLLYDTPRFTASIFPRHARMANFPIPLISKRKPADRFAFDRHARMANFPIGLISRRKPYTGTAIGRHTRMAGWPFAHLINGKTQNALIPGGPRMANFPIPLLSKRTPKDRFAFPRHARMANFPIPLISKRKPADRFAFPRHARMADMILPLVTRSDDPARGRRWSLSDKFGLPTISRR